MPFHKIMFSSQRLDWKTPLGVYDELNKEFHFDFDPCPPHPFVDGLKIEWGQRNFVNPPYGRAISKWIDKAIVEHRKGKLIVLLIASRTDTKWFHRLLEEGAEFRVFKGRLRFDGMDNSAPFPSALAILYPEVEGIV